MCIPPCYEYILSPRAKVQTNQIFKLTRLDSERFMSVIQKKCALACVISLLLFKGKCDLISGFIDATKICWSCTIIFVVYYWNASGKFGEQRLHKKFNQCNLECNIAYDGWSATRNAHSLQHPVYLNAISVDILRITFLSCWKGVIVMKFKHWYQLL